MSEPLDVGRTHAVLGEVMAERQRQVERHGRHPDDDDTLTDQEWAWLLLRRVTDLAHPFEIAHLDKRRELVEIAAIAVAAIEATDRRP